MGETPQQLIKQLQGKLCEEKETEEEILKQYKKMNVKYDPDDLV